MLLHGFVPCVPEVPSSAPLFQMCSLLLLELDAMVDR